MLRSITVSNVNDGLSEALHWLKQDGIVDTSRNGAVLRSSGPVVTTYTNPLQRVMFSALRDANPFFHLMESIWMFAGSDDVHFPARYAKQIAEYSDDGVVLAGAYGRRWRRHFGIDQLTAIIHELRTNPSTRRCVLSMWDGSCDLTYAIHSGRDAPCNTHAYFTMRAGALDMAVLCRSNDAIWGCYGANAVHFSMLLQFVAEAVDVPVGRYTQFSNDLHVYLDRPDVDRLIHHVPEAGLSDKPWFDVRYQPDNRYAHWYMQKVTPLINIGETCEEFLHDAQMFVSDPDGDAVYRTEYFDEVVMPMQIAHTAYKLRDFYGALAAVHEVAAVDWQTAGTEWLERRINNAKQT